MVLAENKENLWNRIEVTEMNPHSYSHLSFDKAFKNVHCQTRQSLQDIIIKLGMLMYVISVLWEVEAGRTGVQSYLWLHNLSPKKEKKTKTRKVNKQTKMEK